MCDLDFEKEQLEDVKAQIRAYRTALTAFATNNGLKSYVLDSGQSKQTVTRQDIDKMKEVLNDLMNEYSILCARVNGTGVTTGRPAW
jgi:aspartate aminotransferase-like enzyme